MKQGFKRAGFVNTWREPVFFSNLQLILHILSDALQVGPGYLPMVPGLVIKLDFQMQRGFLTLFQQPSAWAEFKLDLVPVNAF